MRRVRRPLIALVALFTAAITIDRIGVEHGSDAIASPVYALAALAVILPLSLPSVRRARPWLFAGATFVAYVGTIAVTGWSRLLAGAVLGTELAFLAVATRIGHLLATTLDDLDDTLGAIAFGDTEVLDIESPQAAETIHAELTRSRRHDRPLALTVIAPTEEGLTAATEAAAIEVDRAVRRRYVYGRLARAVGGRLRRTDLLFEHRASGKLFVLSPETDEDGTHLLRKRITEAAIAAGIESEAGVACFPGDAIGLETLVEVAESDLAARSTPIPHLRAVQQSGTA